MSTSTPGAPLPATTAPPTVVVIGGGIAGLSAAWTLAGSGTGVRVVVLEEESRFGGKLRAATIGGRPVDVGPDAFVARRPEALDLCAELGLAGDLVAPASRRAYIWARGRLRPIPTGLSLGVPIRLGPVARAGILSPVGVARLAADALRPGPGRGGDPDGADSSGRVASAGHAAGLPDQAVAAVTSRLGAEVTARLADPLIGGIHAGDTRHMSAAAVFPALLAAAHDGGSLMRALRAQTPAAPPSPDAPVFLTVRDGLERLIERLVEALRTGGVDLRAGSAAGQLALHLGGADGPGVDARRRSPVWTVPTPHGVVEADGVVLATPAPVAAELLRGVDAAASALLARVTYAAVTVVTVRVADDGFSRPLDGTGFLVPRSEGRLVTACTWLSSKWPQLDRPGEVLVRASVGRAGDERHLSMDDDELTRLVLEELGPLSGLRAKPREVLVWREPRAFPQYDVGHLARVDDIERALSPLPAVAVAGAALRGVGIPACIASGRQAARAVLHELADQMAS
jgi:oxygen-dependent protoporphyrinogen oxidase